MLSSKGRKIPESPWGSPIPIRDGDRDVKRFPDGDGDEDEAHKRGWGCDSTGGDISDLDDMDDIEMIMQQLQSEQEQEHAAESSHHRNYIYRECLNAEERFSVIVKCTSAIRQLAYDVIPDALDEYLQMGDHCERDCLDFFTTGEAPESRGSGGSSPGSRVQGAAAPSRVQGAAAPGRVQGA
ncbi:hypothetical protein Tco_0128331 [Tanacetum coccineum]